MSGSSSSDDDITTIVWVVIVGFGLGIFSLSALLEPVQVWLVNVGVLISGDSVLVPIGEGAGLDIWRLVILGGVILLLIAAAWLLIRKRRRTDV